MKAKKKRRAAGRRRPLADLALILLLCAANALWFGALGSAGVIKGDDIGYVLAGRAINSFAGLFAYDGYKYRPVVALLEFLETRLCGSSYGAYFAVNLCFQCVVTALLYRLALRVSRRRSIAFFTGALFVVCPFAYYNVTQVFGMMEAMCVFFLLFIVEFFLRFFKRGRLGWFLLALVFALLIVFTHERFLALWPVLLIGVALCDPLSRGKKLFCAALSVVPFALNVIVKRMLGVTMLMGTAYTPISLSVSSVLGFLLQSLMAVLGVNRGPSFHSGYTYDQYTPLEQSFAWIMFAIAALALIACVARLLLRKNRQKRAYELKCVLLGVLTIGATLLSACVTLYVESRWLLAPYMCVLLLLAFCLRRVNFLHLSEAAALALTVLSCAINVHYRQELGQLYFIQGMEKARAAYDAMIGRYGEALADREVCFLTEDEDLVWALGTPGHSIFDVYMTRPLSWRYVSAEDGVDPSDTVRVFKVSENYDVIELEKVSGYRQIYDLNAWKEKHVVVPDTPAETPTGEGAFFLNGNLTVVSGYRDRVDGLSVPANALIALSASLPYEGSDGAHITVYFTVEGRMVSVCSLDIDPEEGLWDQYFPVGEALEDASLTIGVSSPSIDKESDWVVFSDFRILVKDGE
ncbi:MAG: glycosyltransferase family 39 protein [Clostridia bacterium]|nr:glycosyltransferase family 39 protein [Clostridia bacterium]